MDTQSANCYAIALVEEPSGRIKIFGKFCWPVGQSFQVNGSLQTLFTRFGGYTSFVHGVSAKHKLTNCGLKKVRERGGADKEFSVKLLS